MNEPLPPAPQSPYDFTPPDLEAERRRRRGQQIGLLMALLLTALLFRGLFERDTEYTAAEATRLEKIGQALQAMKPVYGDRAENGQCSLNQTPQAKPLIPAQDYNDNVTRVIKDWREIAELSGSHPADWRRLGMAQAIFNRPEALATLARLPALYAQHKIILDAKQKNRAPKTKTQQREEKHEAAVWKPPVPPAQELALWQTIYGPKPIKTPDVPALRRQVSSLELQWFEPVVLADLYAKANLTAESRRSEAAALASVNYLRFFDTIETAVRLLGLPAAFFFFGWFLRKQNPAPVAPRIAPYGFPSAGQAQYLPEVPAPNVPAPFSYHARMVAFVSYMALPLVIFLPLIVIKKPLAALSDEAWTRLEIVLQIAASLLTAFIALLILRRVDISDRADGTNEARPVSLRETLYQLGYRSRRPAGDVAAGITGYPAVILLETFAWLISRVLFSRFHTPPHPVLLTVSALHTPLDRGLLLIETGIVPPLVEELMFRGLLYPALRERWGIAGGIALSGAIFALVHPTLPGGFLPLWTMGAVWAFTYERRGSLLPCILMHALNNSLLIALDFAALSK